MVESHRSACSALALQFCSVGTATRTKHRPQQHQEFYCLCLGLLLYYLGRLLRETRIQKPPNIQLPGLQLGPKLALSSQLTWTRSRHMTGHSWACTSSEIARNTARV